MITSIRIYSGGKSGTATITISQAAGTNYAAASKTFSAKGKKCISWSYYYDWGDSASCSTAAYCHDPCEYHSYSYWGCSSSSSSPPSSASATGGRYCWCGN